MFTITVIFSADARQDCIKSNQYFILWVATTTFFQHESKMCETSDSLAEDKQLEE